MAYTKQEILGKSVYIVVQHHEVLSAWAEIRRGLTNSPFLLSFDFHTDTVAAFLRSSFHQDRNNYMNIASEWVSAIDYKDEVSVEHAVQMLRNDEHIYTACEADIIKGGFIIQYNDINNSSQEWTEHGLFIVGSEVGLRCESPPCTNAFVREHSNQAIEASYLSGKLEMIHKMSPAVGIENIRNETFILDIDLDYFRTEKSVSPDAPNAFYELVRKAFAITIATEAAYVRDLRLTGETVTADNLLPRVLKHIEAALKNP